jgi:hypothetical protein
MNKAVNWLVTRGLRLRLPQNLRRHVDRDAQGLVAWSASFAAARRPRLVLEIDVGERLPVGVADAEAFDRFIDMPRRREAARFILGVAHAFFQCMNP